MNDSVKPSFADLLRHLERVDQNREISICSEGRSWVFEVRDLTDVFLTALFEVPDLRKALDLALKDVETLQEQIADGTPSFERSKWEYWETPFNPTMNYISHFNKKGAEGWELIHCDFENGKALFKRAK